MKSTTAKEALDAVCCSVGDVTSARSLGQLPRGPRDIYNARYSAKILENQMNAKKTSRNRVKIPFAWTACGPSWNGQRERRRFPKKASSFENVQYTQTYSLFWQMIVNSKGLPNFVPVQKNSVYSELTQLSTFSTAISVSRLPRTETSRSKINKLASRLCLLGRY